MNRIPRYSLIALLAASAVTAAPLFAEVYTWTDAEGNRVFSDQPGPDSEQVQLGPINTVETPPPPSFASPPQASERAERGPAYRQLTISNLQDDQALRANDGTVTLIVETDPPLDRGHLLRAEIGGQPVSAAIPGNGQREHRLDIRNVDRGSHSISAAVVNARGELVQRSAPLELHVQRTSLNQPARAGANQAPQAPAAPRAPNVPAPQAGGN